MNTTYLTGAAVTPHATATQAAQQALEDGGNAVDAALAAAAMLTVLYPNQCSIGGDAIAMVGTADGSAHVVNGTGASAQFLDPADYRDGEGHVPVSGAKSVTVPGLLSAWEMLADVWANRPLSAALHPAATAAAEGVPVAPGVHRDLVREQCLLRQDPGCSEAFFRDGEVLGIGQTLLQGRLAESLRALAEDGTRAFYSGPLGRSLLHTLRNYGSDLTLEDFSRHTSTVETPLATHFNGEEYLSAGGNSQGTFFLQGLAALNSVAEQTGRIPDPVGEEAPVIARILAASAKDRDRLLGDPRYSRIPFTDLLSRKAAAATASSALSGRQLTASTPGHGYGRRSGDTVAIVTADSEGNWVSLIQSAFHAFGSAVLDPKTGILLHNRGASFSLRPGAANELAAARKPPHSLMPVLVRRDGRLIGAHGTMGGRAQPQIHTHLALNLALGLSPAKATERPRWIIGQMEAGPTAANEAVTISAEEAVTQQSLQALADAGFQTKKLPPLDDAVGHLQVVRQDREGSFAIGSDPRSDGLPAARENEAT